MIPALLHGKLTCKQENMEDILTSNVFGMLRYIPPDCGLFRFLAEAKTVEGDGHPLKSLVDPGRSQPVTVEYEFWPQWRNCEPDVAITIRIGGGLLYLVAVEAKFRSGKSSRAAVVDEAEDTDVAEESLERGKETRLPNDQLAREWGDLVGEACRQNARPVLVYLTADVHCPKAEIQASLADCRQPTRTSSEPTICWLSWRELPRLFRHAPDPILADIGRIADRMELTFFEGIAKVGLISSDWAFQGPAASLKSRKTLSRASEWRFDVAQIRCKWRFAG